MSVIDDIKQRLDIVSVVGAVVPLIKSGRSFKANCPFHQERTPSFYVFPDTQTWRCFGACAAGGDLFSFVMKREQMEFGEALRTLAAQAGVELPARGAAFSEPEADARLRDANGAAARYYHNLLLNSPEAAAARGYVEQRAMSGEVVRAFQLGYSPQRRESLRNYLVGEGFTDEVLLAAGLVMEGDRGHFDRFHHRLMFPIADATGAVVGFGARTLDGASPKYLNTPQTALFDKSGLLFGLDRAKDAIRQEKRVVIVEGYMDAITAHQHGFRNVVASMGTALTEKQVSLVARYATDIILALDADAAGQAATRRGLEVAPDALGEEPTAVPDWEWRWERRNHNGRQVTSRVLVGVPRIVGRQKGEIRVLRLPTAKDPDELIRNHPDQWQELVDSSLPMLDFLFESVRERLDLTTPKGKSQAVEDLAPFLQDITNAVEQSHYLQRLSALVGTDERSLRDALPRKNAPRGRGQNKPGDVGGVAAALHPEVLEDYCLALLFAFPELANMVQDLADEHFTSTENRALYQAWQRDPVHGLDALDEWLQPKLDEVRQHTPPVVADKLVRAAFAQCLHRLEQQRLRRLKALHRLRLERLDAAGLTLPLVDGAAPAGPGGAAAGQPDEDSEAVENQELELNRRLVESMRRRPVRAVTE